jgi:cholesterol transport system auxiliary component
MRRIGCGASLITLAVAVVTGCAFLTPATVDTRKEMLTKIPVDLAERKTHPATLLVFPPETSAVYDTTQMAYAIRPYQIAYFGGTEWGERPPQMIHPLLVRTLQKAGYFSAVVTPPFMGHYSYALRTEILALEQDFSSEPAALRLALRVQLIEQAGNRVIATKEIDMREPLREKTPHGGAVAANEAMAKALKEVAEFVHAKAGEHPSAWNGLTGAFGARCYP